MPVVIVLLSWLAYCKFTASSFDQHRRSAWWLPTSTDIPTKLGCHHLHSRSQSPFIIDSISVLLASKVELMSNSYVVQQLSVDS